MFPKDKSNYSPGAIQFRLTALWQKNGSKSDKRLKKPETGTVFCLQQVVRDANLGRRYADKLVKVWLRNGQAAYVLVHVEIQGQTDIDWIMRLPGHLEDRLWDTIHKIEEEGKMPYISSVERIGYKRGLSEGVARAIELGLSLKFGDDAAGSLMPHIHNMHDPDWLMMIKDAIRSTDSIDDIRELIMAKPGQA